MMKLLKDELQELQSRAITEAEECSMDWISAMVVIQRQNGNLRACMDPKPLNKVLKCSY